MTATFQPRMALTLGQGWAKPVELRDALAIDNRRLGGSINVAKLNAALDPSDPVGRRTAAVGTSVDEIAAWLQRHPYLQVTAPVPVTLGGARGVAMDVQLKLPANFPQLPYCAQPCLAVLRVSEERTPVDRIGFIAGHKDRLIILDVNGQRVVVDSLVYSAERFEAFMLEAQKVLDSIAFNPSATPTGSPPPPIGPFGPNDPEPTG